MRIAALTSGLNVPSARFRVRQHIPLLRASGLDVEEHFPAHGGRSLRLRYFRGLRGRHIAPLFAAETLRTIIERVPGVLASYRSDVTWLERNFVPMLDDVAAILKRPLVVDIDDAIWLYNPLGRSTVSRLIRRAAAVIAGNDFLGSWCADYCSAVHVVPTAVDARRFRPREHSADRQSGFTVGWTGSATNFHYLEEIEAGLRQFLARTPGARLLIVAERAPCLRSIPRERVTFRLWSPHNEHALVQEMDVGLMPLADTDLARGKCSFKMLQYMSCAVPCVVSPVGMNAEVLARGAMGLAARSSADWAEALLAYSQDAALREAHGLAGRRIIEQFYDTPIVASQIGNVLRSVA